MHNYLAICWYVCTMVKSCTYVNLIKLKFMHMFLKPVASNIATQPKATIAIILLQYTCLSNFFNKMPFQRFPIRLVCNY